MEDKLKCDINDCDLRRQMGSHGVGVGVRGLNLVDQTLPFCEESGDIQ